MTLKEAYDLLAVRWPTQSFCVSVNVWHYAHLPPDPPAVEYRVWDGERRRTYEGPTLETAMELALGPSPERAGLAAVERTLEGLPGGRS